MVIQLHLDHFPGEWSNAVGHWVTWVNTCDSFSTLIGNIQMSINYLWTCAHPK